MCSMAEIRSCRRALNVVLIVVWSGCSGETSDESAASQERDHGAVASGTELRLKVMLQDSDLNAGSHLLELHDGDAVAVSALPSGAFGFYGAPAIRALGAGRFFVGMRS